MSKCAYISIPVPRDWSVEQAWEAIRRGDDIKEPALWWAAILVEDGKFVRQIEYDEA